jgi:alpha-2-macroglobulin-like protein
MQHMVDKLDAYTLAVLANFAADYAQDRGFTRETMNLLLDTRSDTFWTSQETGVYSTGPSANIETTGLAVQALLKWGEGSGAASPALAYIASKKDARGTWGTTQATIMALRALLLSTEKGSADVRGTLEISLNGKPVQKLTLTPDNNDLLHQFVFKNLDAKGVNSVGIRFEGKGGLAYQVVGNYFLPWDQKPASEPLSIGLTYNRTQLTQDDIATATAIVRNNQTKTAPMVMADLGIPPGFELISEDFQQYQDKGSLEKFSLTPTRAILYFNSIGAGQTVTRRFRLRAKYPLRARTFVSRVYEYYDPEVGSVALPVQLEVLPRR